MATVYTGDIDMERQYPLIEMEVIDYVMMKLLVRAGEIEEDEAVGIDLDMTMAVQDGNGSQVLGVSPSCLFVLNYTNGAEVNGHGSFMMEEEQGSIVTDSWMKMLASVDEDFLEDIFSDEEEEDDDDNDGNRRRLLSDDDDNGTFPVHLKLEFGDAVDYSYSYAFYTSGVYKLVEPDGGDGIGLYGIVDLYIPGKDLEAYQSDMNMTITADNNSFALDASLTKRIDGAELEEYFLGVVDVMLTSGDEDDILEIGLHANGHAVLVDETIANMSSAGVISAAYGECVDDNRRHRRLLSLHDGTDNEYLQVSTDDGRDDDAWSYYQSGKLKELAKKALSKNGLQDLTAAVWQTLGGSQRPPSWYRPLASSLPNPFQHIRRRLERDDDEDDCDSPFDLHLDAWAREEHIFNGPLSFFDFSGSLGVEDGDISADGSLTMFNDAVDMDGSMTAQMGDLPIAVQVELQSEDETVVNMSWALNIVAEDGNVTLSSILEETALINMRMYEVMAYLTIGDPDFYVRLDGSMFEQSVAELEFAGMLAIDEDNDAAGQMSGEGSWSMFDARILNGQVTGDWDLSDDDGNGVDVASTVDLSSGSERILEMAVAVEDTSITFSYDFESLDIPLVSGMLSLEINDEEFADSDYMEAALALDTDDWLIETQFQMTEGHSDDQKFYTKMQMNFDGGSYSYDYLNLEADAKWLMENSEDDIIFDLDISGRVSLDGPYDEMVNTYVEIDDQGEKWIGALFTVDGDMKEQEDEEGVRLFGDMTMVLDGSAASWDMNVFGELNLSSTDAYTGMASAVSVKFESQEVLRWVGTAGTDMADVEHMLKNDTHTRVAAVFDVDKANYLTMDMSVRSMGAIMGTDDEATTPMTCVRMGMAMDEPMAMPMEMNMSMGLWIEDPASEGNLRGISVSEQTLGLSLREYPSDGYRACDNTLAMSMTMAGYGCAGDDDDSSGEWCGCAGSYFSCPNDDDDDDSPSTLAPTVAPTPSTQVTIEVSMEIQADSVLTDAQEEDLKDTIASQLGLDLDNIKNFVVTIEVTDDAVTNDDGALRKFRGRRELLGKTYTWVVSFDVVVALDDTEYATASDLTEAIVEDLQDDSFEEAVETNTGVSVTVDADSISTTIVERSSPTSSPIASKKKKSTSEGSMLIIIFIVVGVLLGTGCLGFLCAMQMKGNRSKKADVYPSDKPLVEMTQTNQASGKLSKVPQEEQE
uniref:Uncharacterized protein n=2 Tax=Octactis speculum TaxID=3111310 RepID=A0A7S2FU69_9STRA